ncbi:MAG: phosphoribosylanthranilate isomerase, partial [Chloroflexi bacterium]|nr:phosphoribosylanthranilate isomerase [Chloroflexota bacterium]
MTLVKICGTRSLTDARIALAAGANLLGFIFWKPGKRYIAPADAARIIAAVRAESHWPTWSAVGVFVDPSVEHAREVADECQLDLIQLSGDEPADLVRSMPRPTLKAIHVRAGHEHDAAAIVASNALGADRYLLDTHADDLPGGTGRAFDWHAFSGIGPTCLVAGGLRADNVVNALDALSPYGVDVSTGVELAGGGKDPRLI